MHQQVPAHRPRVLAVGAVERDNFGDLLYALLLKDHLRSWSLAFGAPIAPAESPLDDPVSNWADLLGSEEFAGTWAVGGEVGATPPEYAFLTMFGIDARRRLAHSSLEERRVVLAEAMGGRVLDPPYIPRPSDSALNADVPLIISSVGLSGIAREPGWRQPRLIGALREADFLSVRDRASSRYLDEVGIPHRLAPDLAHVIAGVRPRAFDPAGPVLVHLSEHALKHQNADAWAAALQAALPRTEIPIRLFTAGLAPGHDSMESARDLADALRRLDADRDITVSPAADVWSRVDEIAAARLWIGASLHGRIIASAYGVPRISLAKPKVDAYAEDWDGGQPYGVVPETLPEAVAAALAEAPVPREDLAEAALANLAAAESALRDAASGDRVGRLGARLAARRQEVADTALVAQRLSAEIGIVSKRSDRQRALTDSAEARVRAVRADLTVADGERKALLTRLDSILGSRRWRLFETMDRAKERLRGR